MPSPELTPQANKEEAATEEAAGTEAVHNYDAATAAGKGGDDEGASAGIAPPGEDAESDVDDDTDININNGGPPAKRPRRNDDDDDTDEDDLTGPKPDVQQAVIQFKRKKGTVVHVIYGKDLQEDLADKSAEKPFGIKFATVKVKSAHSFLTHFYELSLGEKYRGRPPTASDQTIIVESVSDSATTLASVRRNDVLLFIDDKLVNITDKKRLNYYKARINNSARPIKLSFFRPAEGEEDPDEEDMELDPSEAVYVTKYEPAEELNPPSKAKARSGGSEEDRAARRALLERRQKELELLLAETTAELSELRAQDGILAGITPLFKEPEMLNVKGDEDFVIPSHIMYYPPMKLRRKQLPSLNEACNKVENLLRQRMMIDQDAEKIRTVVKQAQARVGLKDKELAVMDEKMAPALEQVKFIEMEVHDNWKVMYLKLKDYYEENGHSNVMEKEDSKLSKWITRQRTCYANAQLEEPSSGVGIIKPYQYDLLNRLEFCWNPREQQFTQNIASLKAYKREHGNTNVPIKYENIHLANFVQKWRREHRLFQEGKPCNMSQDRLQVLEEAGFSWRDPSRTRKRSDTKQETWDGFISQLSNFHYKYGHFMVNKVNKTLEKGNRLGRLDEFCGWVRKQYSLYKVDAPCQLTDAKVKQLKDMGFWLERGQSIRFSQQAKKEAVPLLGQLQVPKIDELGTD